MWRYEKTLQYPVNIKNPDPALAKVIVSQLGGANTKKIYPTIIKKLPFIPYLHHTLWPDEYDTVNECP